MREQRRLPVGLLETIVEYRHYAAAYHANRANPHGATTSPMRALALQIEMDLAEEEHVKQRKSTP